MYYYFIGMIGCSGSYNAVMESIWYWAPDWIVVFLGFATLFYGIKRIIDNALKIKIIGDKFKVQPSRYQPPAYQTYQKPPERQ